MDGPRRGIGGGRPLLALHFLGPWMMIKCSVLRLQIRSESHTVFDSPGNRCQTIPSPGRFQSSVPSCQLHQRYYISKLYETTNSV